MNPTDFPRSPSKTSPGPALSRVVGLGGAVWMGLGSILGTGVFVSLAIVAGVAGSGAGLLLAVGLAALVATANGLSSAQLAAAHPVSGGTYEYAHRFVSPAAGFAAGWMFLAAKSASAATAALGCAGYLLSLFGPTRSDAVFSGAASGGIGLAGAPSEPLARVALALLLVLGTTALVAGGVQRSNRANLLIVSMTLVSLTAFVLAGVAHMATLEPLAREMVLAPATSGSVFTPALLHATALMFVAYTGYGRIATLGEEVRDPTRSIPRAIVITLIVSMVVYVSVAFVSLAAVGAASFAATTSLGAAPLETVARQVASPAVASVVAFGAITAMAGVLLNLILGLSRVMLAMARRRDMPEGLAHIDGATRSPARAVWAMGLFVAALTLIGDLRLTWSFSAFTVLIYYGLTHVAALRLPASTRRVPALVAWAGLVSCFALAFFVPPLVWAGGALLLGVGFLFRSRLRQKDAPQPS